MPLPDSTIDRAKKLLMSGRAPCDPHVFEDKETVRLKIANAGPRSWRTFRAQFLGYVVCQGKGINEHPQFMGISKIDNRAKAFRIPEGKTQATKEFDAQLTELTVAVGHNMDKGTHEVYINCAAFDTFLGNWEAFLEGLKADVNKYGQSAIASIPYGAATAQGLLETLKRIVDSLFSGSKIGSSRIVLDTGVTNWFVPGDFGEDYWCAYKWLLFEKGDAEQVYLTLWKFDLSTAGQDWEVGYLTSPETQYAVATNAVSAEEEYAAAIRLFQGEDVVVLAESYNLEKEAIEEAGKRMMEAGPGMLDKFIRSGILAEISALRARIERLEKK